MKLLSLITIMLFGSIFVQAQIDCQPYLPQEKGSKWEITNYTKKGKVTGKNTFELIDKVEDGNTITFTVASQAFDKKDKLLFDNTFEAKCVEGKFEFDMDYKLENSMMGSFKNMEFTMDASEFELPPFGSDAGTELPDGSLVVEMDEESPLSMKMTVKITDRKVEGQENVTTPAGTFDCLVMTQNTSINMIVNINGSSKEWYAQNVGMVRSESYNKRGKLLGYSVLTKLTVN